MAIPVSPKGWPYLAGGNLVDEIPEYTAALTAKLDGGDADAAAIINAAGEAKTARDQAVAAAQQPGEVAALNIASGSATVTVPTGFTGGQVVDAAVTFPAGRFTNVPAVVATPSVSVYWAFSVVVIAVSATSCTLRLVCDRDYTAGSSFSVTINWIAVQV